VARIGEIKMSGVWESDDNLNPDTYIYCQYLGRKQFEVSVGNFQYGLEFTAGFDGLEEPINGMINRDKSIQEAHRLLNKLDHMITEIENAKNK
jgi:hypothetical protein